MKANAVSLPAETTKVLLSPLQSVVLSSSWAGQPHTSLQQSPEISVPAISSGL